MNELAIVLEQLGNRAGNALGHAGKTSEVFWRGRAAYGSVAAIIGSNPAAGASLGQGICGLVHLFGGGRRCPVAR
jgi:hypothetical protein